MNLKLIHPNTLSACARLDSLSMGGGCLPSTVGTAPHRRVFLAGVARFIAMHAASSAAVAAAKGALLDHLLHGTPLGRDVLILVGIRWRPLGRFLGDEEPLDGSEEEERVAHDAKLTWQDDVEVLRE